MRSAALYVLLCSCLLTVFSCKKDKTKDPVATDENDPLAKIENTYGFGVLDKVKGIWNGPVTSNTPLGGYPEWIVDFRPIAENQVSAKNELDTLNDIHMSFFVAKYKGQYRVAFRNGGSFGGQTRVSYFLADSVHETATESFYRFTEIVKGKSRAFTDVIFRSDSLIINSYTNHYNTLAAAEPHMSWKAKLQDATSCEAAVNHFAFPKKTLAKDFTNAFSGVMEAIYYSISGGDPYPENMQPYLGKANVTYSFAGTYTPNPANKVFLMITTQPLISGFSFNTANLKYRSRYVILAAGDLSYTFNYMHPGTYYVYALYDNDGNNTFSSGDWASSANSTFTLPESGNVNASATINFTIP